MIASATPECLLFRCLVLARLDYSPDQPRAENGQWGEESGNTVRGAVASTTSNRLGSAHAKAIHSFVDDETTSKILGTLNQKELEFLENHPLSRFEIRDGPFGVDELEGQFSGRDSRISVAANLDSSHFGDEFVPHEAWGVSDTRATSIEASQAVLLHEFGHKLSNSIDSDTVKEAFSSGKPITQYGTTSPREYFAESYSCYRVDRDMLEKHDPVGFRMISNAVRELGLE
jgi:hypothetical protein